MPVLSLQEVPADGDGSCRYIFLALIHSLKIIEINYKMTVL